jgi:hypothetical protein
MIRMAVDGLEETIMAAYQAYRSRRRCSLADFTSGFMAAVMIANANTYRQFADMKIVKEEDDNDGR